MLKIVNVTKTFGDITALENVSLKAEKGDFIFVTGPSGSGKTTLLKLILREYLPDSGQIEVDGKDVTKLSPKEIPALRQEIGTVFQDFKILPERTVRENIEVALAVTGISEGEWRARVDNVLSLVELMDRSDLFPSQLSGGELQRVSLARALVTNPKLILADEPTGNLDWETAERLMDLFEKINREGKTIIMATHHKGIIDERGAKRVELKKVKKERAETAEEEIGDEPKKKKKK